MTRERKRRLLLNLFLFSVAGVGSSFVSLVVFFGGSDRDPGWAWALYCIFLFGGAIVALVCFLAFFVVLGIRPLEPRVP